MDPIPGRSRQPAAFSGPLSLPSMNFIHFAPSQRAADDGELSAFRGAMMGQKWGNGLGLGWPGDSLGPKKMDFFAVLRPISKLSILD